MGPTQLNKKSSKDTENFFQDFWDIRQTDQYSSKE